MKKVIVINDVEYSNIDEVPEELRYLLLDENNNGIPDYFEKTISSGN